MTDIVAPAMPKRGDPMRAAAAGAPAPAEEIVELAAELVGDAAWPLEAIGVLRRLEAAVDDALQAAVADARSRGLSWETVAQRLGMRRQGAWRRFR